MFRKKKQATYQQYHTNIRDNNRLLYIKGNVKVYSKVALIDGDFSSRCSIIYTEHVTNLFAATYFHNNANENKLIYIFPSRNKDSFGLQYK